MMNFLVGSLLCLSFFFGHRWLGSRAENGKLRSHIVALKRQLAARRDR